MNPAAAGEGAPVGATIQASHYSDNTQVCQQLVGLDLTVHLLHPAAL